MSDTPRGHLLRLWGLTRSQLPPLPSTPSTLTPFLTALLSEALPFIDSVSPKSSPSPSTSSPPANTPSPSPWKVKSTKHLPASSSPIRLLTRIIPSSSLLPLTTTLSLKQEEIKSETWACRLSLHPDAPRAGTASWAEFKHAIKDRHAETEEAFTPSVVSAREVMRWDCDGVGEVEIGGGGGGQRQRWGKFTLAVVEMRHKVGRPVLKDRVFGVLQMTGSLLDAEGREREEFVVVSVSVRDFGVAGEETGESSTEKGEVVVGRYVSVERVRKLEKTQEEGEVDGEGKIEWLMATASDAGGVLPAWVQARAVPGQIAKDVGLFLRWVQEERKKRDWDGETVGGKKGKMETSVTREQAASRRQMGYSSAGAGLT
ncbi:hypothetical protein GE09DRAFT_445704 [Coniochaeta sp. 2T2.1]|nr:hypothetical protein GE09DRAFT_445704 [Coniochaeta sp. 2T2.1]